jgi:hypothetical protein
MTEDSGVRWLLLGLVLVLLAVVGALVYGGWAGPASPPPVAGPAGGPVTACQAFAPAAELAARWQADARLAAVSGRWSAVGEQPVGQVEWAFQFFSPSTQRLALVLVAGEAARMVRESLSPYVVPAFSAEEWRVDSNRALQVWWEHGGSTVVARRPDTDLVMQLRLPEQGSEHPIWTVTGLVAGAKSSFTVVVDATSGVLME